MPLLQGSAISLPQEVKEMGLSSRFEQRTYVLHFIGKEQRSIEATRTTTRRSTWQRGAVSDLWCRSSWILARLRTLSTRLARNRRVSRSMLRWRRSFEDNNTILRRLCCLALKVILLVSFDGARTWHILWKFWLCRRGVRYL